MERIESGELLEADSTSNIIAAAIDVHRELGPGLLESAYQASMCHELGQEAFHSVRRWSCRSNIRESGRIVATVLIWSSTIAFWSNSSLLNVSSPFMKRSYLRISG